MVYLEYEQLKQKYRESQKYYQEVLDKKEILFQRTQPHSMQYDKEKISGGEYLNKNDEYMIYMEEIWNDLKVAEVVLAYRLEMISAKEQELRLSRMPEDIIYYMRYLDRLKIPEIAEKTYYSERTIYRFLRIIGKNIKDGRK